MDAYLNEAKLEKYLGKDLYCREERQFAVFLYNYLYEKRGKDIYSGCEGNKLIKCCLNLKDDTNIDIKNVYFEVSLMRDYFANTKDDFNNNDEKDANVSKGNDNKGKKEFNKKLLKFCLEWLPKETLEKQPEGLIDCLDNILNRNLGQGKTKKIINDEYSKKYGDLKVYTNILENKDLVRGKACFDIAGMMMNAIFDIIVEYKMDNDTYVKALECKYESEEGAYKDVVGAEYPMQLFIQECIMAFCFGKRKNMDGTDDDEEIEKNIPRFPKNSKIWGDRKKKGKKEEYDKYKLWEEICEYVYKGILKQKRESENLINAGVEMISFVKKSGEANNTINDEEEKNRHDIADIIINNEVIMQIKRGRH